MRQCLIYGANLSGVVTYSLLKKQGLSVCGFIDRSGTIIHPVLKRKFSCYRDIHAVPQDLLSTVDTIYIAVGSREAADMIKKELLTLLTDINIISIHDPDTSTSNYREIMDKVDVSKINFSRSKKRNIVLNKISQLRDNYLVISGLPGGSSGLGRFVQYLAENNKGNYSIIVPGITHDPEAVRELKGRRVVLMHPQSIGFELTIELIRNNKTYYYLIDNSFFCMKSYNHLPGETRACLQCVGGRVSEAILNQCEPSPVTTTQALNEIFLNRLFEYKDSIVFLAQNEQQRQLAIRHFGGNITCHVIGVITADMLHNSVDLYRPVSNNYDIVFHGRYVEAKGALFCLQLSRLLPDYSFLLPVALESVNRQLDQRFIREDYPNVIFDDMDWNSGLAHHVSSCKIVMTPSLWSAPIEGALIKSILHNGVVAVAPTAYSLAQELPDDVVVKLNTESLEESAILLADILENVQVREEIRNRAWEWARRLLLHTYVIDSMDQIVMQSNADESEELK